ncbi:hypothetical protein [Limosilactobacillus allomucosae]|uniref:hypothetical protein n=1 Tax=Limosilactobacillus allomucosae TaxID=3142938 RepID=UPI00326725D9
MIKNEIVEISTTLNNRETIGITVHLEVQLDIYQNADTAMIENLIKLLVDHVS